MNSAPGSIVEQALSVRTYAELCELWDVLGASGANYTRPVGDRWGNRGLFTAAGGSFDHKLVELATNMHDALLMRFALERFPDVTEDELGFATRFDSPRDAADIVLAGTPLSELAGLCSIELATAGEAGNQRRHRSVVFRDFGVGMEPIEVPGSLFRVGSSRKDGVLWQSGAFGRGGLTVLPECLGWVVVTRKQVTLLDPDQPDVVTVAAVRWMPVGNRQTETALYQVTSPWGREGETALPFTVAATHAPTFEAGTHLCVVAFESEGIWVSRLGDERSIDIMLDTRLFEPVLPLTLTTPVLEEREGRRTVLRGLGRRLANNPRTDRLEGQEDMPFSYRGRTLQLRVRYYLFPTGDTGSRRRFVARDHALIFLSNGQAHSHWSPAEFRIKTELPKLADRVLVVVDTDALPLELRTKMFTADRTELLRSEEAVRLEQELISFLNEWSELRAANNDLIREAILRSNAGRSTLGLALRISRALEARGFDTGVQRGEGRSQSAPAAAPTALLQDPTELAGPSTVSAARGRTVGVHLRLNAVDDFVPNRGRLRVTCTHPDIDPDDGIAVGSLRGGRIRVSLAVPPDADPVEADLQVVLDDWMASSGGLGRRLEHVVHLRITDEDKGRRSGAGGSGNPVPREQGLPGMVVFWTSGDAEEGWTPSSVGSVERIDAAALAEVGEEYRGFAGVEGQIPVLKLNEIFAPLKHYASLRAREVGDEGVARTKDRYALGVGVQMFLIERELGRARAAGAAPPDEFVERLRAAAARGVLAVLPDFDRLVAEAGLDIL